MDRTSRWALPLLFAGQAQKEIFHNEALTLLDALVHGEAESADLSAPPADPEPGRCWIVATGGSGDWAGKDGDVAIASEGGWRFVTPRAGLELRIANRNVPLFHDGAQWRDGQLGADALFLGGDRVVGVRQAAIDDPTGGGVIDAQARATIAAILQALRTHGLVMS
ncbi:MAG: hypothetical protein DI606_19710 [Sphingobium sp.]|jgi:hypothetical protein|uniref:DUF2793 domain-containing protein n=1 Tax=Sphingobium sp. TaxID=1912891 RepID=UPI000DB2E8EA|nr:DUF2793 domain-containing protein [Sphingobium sp.]PZU05511.1 MAG: hypothetical protein DI606_19710 [Sphingobium sp.]